MKIKSSQWITVSRDAGDICPVFRRQFAAEKEMVKAELQVTALGVYFAQINGQRVGCDVLARMITVGDSLIRPACPLRILAERDLRLGQIGPYDPDRPVLKSQNDNCENQYTDKDQLPRFDCFLHVI